MKRYGIVLPILGALLMFGGCATTPQSIKHVSALELQMQSDVSANVSTALAAYDAEMRYWQDKAFQQHLAMLESRLVDAEGKVSLDAYKKATTEIVSLMAQNEARYDKNLADIQGALKTKFDKLHYLSLLINEFENSTGVAPETMAVLIDELGATATGIAEVVEVRREQREAEAAAKPPSLRDRLELMTGDVFDQIYERVQAGLSEVTLPVPVEFGVGGEPK